MFEQIQKYRMAELNKTQTVHENIGLISNDGFVWVENDADMELIEPKILVSVNRNYLIYGRKMGRPPLTHQLILVNHGDHPVAFKVQTTNNYAYFVNQVYGIIPGRRFHAIPHIRAPNSFTLVISRRPYACFADELQVTNWNTPRKDTLFIQLCPAFSYSIPPATLFHNDRPHEKLRICLEYTGMPSDTEKDRALIFKKIDGWCTWKVVEKKKCSGEFAGNEKWTMNEPYHCNMKYADIKEKKKEHKKEMKSKARKSNGEKSSYHTTTQTRDKSEKKK